MKVPLNAKIEKWLRICFSTLGNKNSVVLGEFFFFTRIY